MVKEFDIINFTNIDIEDYEGMWGGEVKLIKAGETTQFPAFLADHYAKHLVDKILLRQGVSDYSDVQLRKPLLEKILGNVYKKAEKEIGIEETQVKEEPEFVDVPKEEVKEPEVIEPEVIEPKVSRTRKIK